eukprot:RCo022887
MSFRSAAAAPPPPSAAPTPFPSLPPGWTHRLSTGIGMFIFVDPGGSATTLHPVTHQEYRGVQGSAPVSFCSCDSASSLTGASPAVTTPDNQPLPPPLPFPALPEGWRFTIRNDAYVFVSEQGGRKAFATRRHPVTNLEYNLSGSPPSPSTGSSTVMSRASSSSGVSDPEQVLSPTRQRAVSLQCRSVQRRPSPSSIPRAPSATAASDVPKQEYPFPPLPEGFTVTQNEKTGAYIFWNPVTSKGNYKHPIDNLEYNREGALKSSSVGKTSSAVLISPPRAVEVVRFGDNGDATSSSVAPPPSAAVVGQCVSGKPMFERPPPLSRRASMDPLLPPPMSSPKPGPILHVGRTISPWGSPGPETRASASSGPEYPHGFRVAVVPQGLRMEEQRARIQIFAEEAGLRQHVTTAFEQRRRILSQLMQDAHSQLELERILELLREESRHRKEVDWQQFRFFSELSHRCQSQVEAMWQAHWEATLEQHRRQVRELAHEQCATRDALTQTQQGEWAGISLAFSARREELFQQWVETRAREDRAAQEQLSRQQQQGRQVILEQEWRRWLELCWERQHQQSLVARRVAEERRRREVESTVLALSAGFARPSEVDALTGATLSPRCGLLISSAQVRCNGSEGDSSVARSQLIFTSGRDPGPSSMERAPLPEETAVESAPVGILSRAPPAPRPLMAGGFPRLGHSSSEIFSGSRDSWLPQPQQAVSFSETSAPWKAENSRPTTPAHFSDGSGRSPATSCVSSSPSSPNSSPISCHGCVPSL